MGLFSVIFGGGESYKKKRQQEAMMRASGGQSVVGNLTGSSPYMQEWRSQKKNLVKQYKYSEMDLRKKWGYEDQSINRDIQKERERYYRKYKDPKEAQKWFSKWETNYRRDIQRGRDKELRAMKEEKNQQQREIAKNIKNYGSRA